MVDLVKAKDSLTDLEYWRQLVKYPEPGLVADDGAGNPVVDDGFGNLAATPVDIFGAALAIGTRVVNYYAKADGTYLVSIDLTRDQSTSKIATTSATGTVTSTADGSGAQVPALDDQGAAIGNNVRVFNYYDSSGAYVNSYDASEIVLDISRTEPQVTSATGEVDDGQGGTTPAVTRLGAVIGNNKEVWSAYDALGAYVSSIDVTEPITAGFIGG